MCAHPLHLTKIFDIYLRSVPSLWYFDTVSLELWIRIFYCRIYNLFSVKFEAIELVFFYNVSMFLSRFSWSCSEEIQLSVFSVVYSWFGYVMFGCYVRLYFVHDYMHDYIATKFIRSQLNNYFEVVTWLHIIFVWELWQEYSLFLTRCSVLDVISIKWIFLKYFLSIKTKCEDRQKLSLLISFVHSDDEISFFLIFWEWNFSNSVQKHLNELV